MNGSAPQPDVLVPRADAPLAVARAELTLARGNIHPLGDPDPEDVLNPVWRLSHGLLKVDPTKGERAVIAVDLLPLAPGERGRLRRRIARRAAIARRLRLGSFVAGSQLALSDPETQDLEQDIMAQVLAERLRQLENPFRVQILIRCEARGRRRARWIVDVLAAGFDQYAGRNNFEVHGWNLGVAFQSSADLPVLRQFFDFRVRTGMFMPLRRRVISAYELRHLTGPLTTPSDMGSPDNYVHRIQGGQVLETVRSFDYGPDLLPTGLIYSRLKGIDMAAASLNDVRLSMTVAKAGAGKTELALNEFVQLARNDHGCLLLHPHQEAIDRVRPYLAPAADRLVEVNLGDRATGAPGWNPFDLSGRTPREVAARSEAILAAFRGIFGWGGDRDEAPPDKALTRRPLAHRAEAVVGMAIHALLELSLVLPRELTPTIFQLPRFVLDGRWRYALLPFLSPVSRRFWATRFRRPQEDTFGPTLVLLEQLRKWPAAAAMLSAREPTYDARTAMDQGQAVLLCTGGLTLPSRFVANLFAFDLLHQGLLRGKGNGSSEPRPFYPIIDHFDVIDGSPTPNLGELLERGLEYQVYPHLLTSRLASLDPQTVRSILSHDTRLTVGPTDPASITLIQQEWPTFVGQSTEILYLEKYAFLASHDGGHVRGSPYQATTVSLDYLWRDHHDPAAARPPARAARTPVPPDPADLEERIRDWATGAGRPAAPIPLPRLAGAGRGRPRRPVAPRSSHRERLPGKRPS